MPRQRARTGDRDQRRLIPPQARAVSIGFGIQLTELSAEVAERFRLATRQGAVVLDVPAGSPSGRAGIRPGDVIVRFDGRQVTKVEDVLAALRGRKPGDRVTITIIRDRERR